MLGFYMIILLLLAVATRKRDQPTAGKAPSLDPERSNPVVSGEQLEASRSVPPPRPPSPLRATAVTAAPVRIPDETRAPDDQKEDDGLPEPYQVTEIYSTPSEPEAKDWKAYASYLMQEIREIRKQNNRELDEDFQSLVAGSWRFSKPSPPPERASAVWLPPPPPPIIRKPSLPPQRRVPAVNQGMTRAREEPLPTWAKSRDQRPAWAQEEPPSWARSRDQRPAWAQEEPATRAQGRDQRPPWARSRDQIPEINRDQAETQV